jgi:hypothetical protein
MYGDPTTAKIAGGYLNQPDIKEDRRLGLWIRGIQGLHR